MRVGVISVGIVGIANVSSWERRHLVCMSEAVARL